VLINANDGDTNFDRGSMVQNKISTVTELDLSWRNFGLFARGRAYYDDVYDQHTDQGQAGPQQTLTNTGHQLHIDDAHNQPGEQYGEGHRYRYQANTQHHLLTVGREVSQKTRHY